MKRAIILATLLFLAPLATSTTWATCTAQHDCGDGNTVTCTGNSTCSVTIAGVKCDGVETKCPNYCTVADACTDCNYYITCWSTSGNCSETEAGISCNGSTPRHCRCPFHP